MLEFIGQLLGPAETVLVIAALIIITGIKILKEYERAVIFRLGRMVAPRGPGITYVIPLVEKMLRVDLRTVTMDVPPQEIITRIQGIIDSQTDPWGIKVVLVEVKHIDLPQEMQRAMAKQAEAERERRAKVIGAEGEFQAAQKLSDAAKILGEDSIALQLRFLQTLREVAEGDNR